MFHFCINFKVARGHVSEDVYFLFAFEALHNALLGISELLKTMFSYAFSATLCTEGDGSV